ncbi:MAG: hypothetical protein EOP07_10530 [Proteobacteria bacterium]|nr:MAG: hypothetical protein EOP07_10530 [Pseudomonadota bacterium]
MKRSNIIIALVAALAIAVIAMLITNRKGLGLSDSHPIANIPNGEQLSYDLKMHLTQKPGDMQELDLYYLEGKLEAYLQPNGDLVSEWSKIADFKMLAQAVPSAVVASMQGKPFVTKRNNKNLEHFIGMEFPGRYLGLQLSILDKAFITETEYKEKSETRQERDELGQFNIQYSFAKTGQDMIVTRRWLQSIDNSSIIDANDNALVYQFNPKGQLQSVKGKLVFNYRAANGKIDIYTTEFSMELNGGGSIPSEKFARATTALPKADLARAEVASQAALAQDEGAEAIEARGTSLEESLQRVDKFSKDSPGEEQQEIFTNIKLGLMANPSDAGKVIEKIVALKGTDDDTISRSALLFGAITATGLPQIADNLVDLAQTQCPDESCKMQAITSLNIHSHPSDSNGKAMLSLAKTSSDEDLSSAAYLAAGSIASKTNSDSPDVSQTLINDLQAAKTEDQKITLLKAMGNHGSAEYLPTLQEKAKSEDTLEKSSALYSMRNIIDDGATHSLIASLNVEGSDIVNVNALRALATRPLPAGETMKVAETFVSATDKDVQQAMTDLLLNNYRANAPGAEDAINLLKEKATDADLKLYLEAQVKEIAEDKKKDSLYEKQ